MSQEGEQPVVLINRITLAKVSLPAEQVAEYLKKHTLWQVMPVAEPKVKKARPKKMKKPTKPLKTELQSRKRSSPEVALKTSPSSTPSEIGDVGGISKRARSEKYMDSESKGSATLQSNNNLLVISLGEVLEIIRLYASATPSPSCADWSSIAAQVCKSGRISANDAEYIANEFIPTVHYRPSIGMVVMERSARNQASEYHRHKLTLRRMKHGLPLIVEKFQEIILGRDPLKEEGETSIGDFSTTTIQTPDQACEQIKQEEIQEEEDLESVVAPQSTSSKRATPAGRNPNRTLVTVSNFASLAPQEYLRDLQNRADATIARYETGEVPLYALKPINESDAMAAGLTATGRVKRRYETKAIRLAKAAAAAASGDTVVDIPADTPKSSAISTGGGQDNSRSISAMPSPPSFSLQSIFQKTAEQFARSRAASSASSVVTPTSS